MWKDDNAACARRLFKSDWRRDFGRREKYIGSACGKKRDRDGISKLRAVSDDDRL